jgi:transposase
MRQNVSFSIGNLAIIEKADADFNFFKDVFKGVEGKAKSFIPSVKLLIYNRLGDCLSINRLGEFTPKELFSYLGSEEPISDRTNNRTLERLGIKAPMILINYQWLIKQYDLASKIQHVDFSSSYFIGEQCKMGKLGYSRDHRPGNLQITYGISTGTNKIPTALTIQNGNVVDKEHMATMLKLCSKVLEAGSILIFDCGANTKKNKEKIISLGFDYLTLKPKKKSTYKVFIQEYLRQKKEKTLVEVKIGDQVYLCAKCKRGGEFHYIFFSKKTKSEQMRIKHSKLKRKLEKNDMLLKKVKRGKEFKPIICSEGWITTHGNLQKCLGEIPNPFITGLEGYFILESSRDMEPQMAMELYKDRDKSEKLIRDMKEGAEIRPIRHWSTNAVKGYLLLIFLTNALINLTLFKAKNHAVSNLKLLKKYIGNLTLAVMYPKNAFRVEILTNNSVEMRALFGDFLKKYGDCDLDLRW